MSQNKTGGMSLKLAGPTPEQQAIIARKEGVSKLTPKEEEGAQEPSASPKQQADTASSSSRPSQRKPRRKKQPTPEIEGNDDTIPKTYQIPRTVATKLALVSAQRKVDKIVPSTQQDIVAAALRAWFEKEGE